MLRSSRSVDHVPVQQSITVVIADHHPPIRHIVQQQFQNEPDIEVLAEAESGKDALALAHKLQPDVLIIEHRLPDMSALYVLAQLQSAPHLRTHVLVYTGYDCPQIAQMLLHAGVAGFLSKADSHSIIPQAVRQVTRGQHYISPRVAHDLATARAVGSAHHRFKETLSARDFDVLRLLGEGFTNVEIAEQLKLGKRTIREHVEKICRVLDLDHAYQAVAWAAANGFGRPKRD